MKTLILSFATIISSAVFAQDADYECKKLRLRAGEAIKEKKYAEAAAYYTKAEPVCGNFDKDTYTRMISCYQNAIIGEKDAVKQRLLMDTILLAYDRADAKFGIDENTYLAKGYYNTKATKPDLKKADLLLATGIQKAGLKATDQNIINYYSNILNLFNAAVEPEKAVLKKRLMTEYFVLSKVVTDAPLKPETQTALTGILNNSIKSCADFTTELKGYMKSLPQDKVMKKATVMNYMGIMEAKKCTATPEYEMLSDTLMNIEPTAAAFMGKANLLLSKKKYADAIENYKKAKNYNPTDSETEEINYKLFVAYVNAGQSGNASNQADKLSGKYRGEGIKYKAQNVASSVNKCGVSTFERKCNYYYALQLLDQAESAGANVTSLRAAYKKNLPTKNEIFKANKKAGDTVFLTCHGVSVTLR